ncbi:MAG: CheR family methyltransferase, partial [Myxococcaceae bacterium]
MPVNSPVKRPPGSEQAQRATGVASLVRAVERRFGLRLHPGFHSTLADRVKELRLDGGEGGLEELALRLENAADGDPLTDAVRTAASIGETYFCRAPDQLRALGELVATELLPGKRQRGAKTLRAWSAGCASGEEAYGLAVLLGSIAPDFGVQVVGSDMNRDALSRARAGCYSGRAFREVPPEEIQGLVRAGNAWEVSPELRKKVSFVESNLATDEVPPSERGLFGFDVVLCRNVLIYLDPARLGAVMGKLAAASARRSVLALGPAEYPAARHLEGYVPRGPGLLLRAPAAAAPSRKRPAPEAAAPAPKSAPPPPPDAARPTPLEQARAAADAGELPRARALASLAMEREPAAFEPCVLAAEIELAAGCPAEAVRLFERALFLDRRCAAAELGLG